MLARLIQKTLLSFWAEEDIHQRRSTGHNFTCQIPDDRRAFDYLFNPLIGQNYPLSSGIYTWKIQTISSSPLPVRVCLKRHLSQIQNFFHSTVFKSNPHKFIGMRSSLKVKLNSMDGNQDHRDSPGGESLLYLKVERVVEEDLD